MLPLELHSLLCWFPKLKNSAFVLDLNKENVDDKILQLISAKVSIRVEIKSKLPFFVCPLSRNVVNIETFPQAAL
jgi:hypothetical protein